MRKYLLTVIGLVLLCLLAALGTASGSPGTVTVDSTTDVSDGVTSSISNLNATPGPDGVISLREAIEAANNTAGTDTIAFNIPLADTGYEVSGITGTWTISLTSSLPITGGGTIISGTTQAASQGDLNPDGPEIEISGASLSGAHCLIIESASNVVHGLVINRCPLMGVLIQTAGADTNTVSGNYIGTDASGSTALGNKIGVAIAYGTEGNVVGGDTPEERNVISGNDQYGVHIYGDDADRNRVSGNYIGTDATGAQDLGNAEIGVAISSGAKNNTVGGDSEGERNIISGNDGDGVSISASGATTNTVSGNYIGTDVSGTQALGNSGAGVNISGGAQNNTVGGDTEGERNVISANWMGVNIVGTDTMSNTVSGNYIGIDVAGSSDLGNTSAGVQIASGAQNNTVGGQTAGERNVISANKSYGVNINGSEADSNTVAGNYIGTDAGGTQELGNTLDGVMIADGAENNTIGGQTAGERNVIAASTWSGVHINGASTDGNTVSQNYIGTDVTGTQDKGNGFDGVTIDNGAHDNTVGPNNLIAHNDKRGVYVAGSGTTGNTITQNSIHSNGGSYLGIDLYDGGNDELPPPAVSSTSCITITGTAPLSATVELFTSPDDEGKTYLTTVSADGSGNWSASGILADDAYLTTTATDAAGNTSEFAALAGCGTLTVNTTDDTDDSTCNAFHCSLREAIDAANSDPGSTIEFSIPVTDTGYQVSGITGTWTIPLTSSLPFLIGGGTVISGTTQAANQGDLNLDGPEIEITGAGVGSGNCLQVTSASNVIHGLVINRCPLHGISIVGSGAMSNAVSGNYIGTDASGSSDLGNAFHGVQISSGAQNNTVGGQTAGERNVISGNGWRGVYIRLDGTDDNIVSGNYIGTDAGGTQELGNTYDGVMIDEGAQNNTIGGQTTGERNVISGNGWSGVYIKGEDTDGNTVSHNYIGTDVTGTQDVGNSYDGVRINNGAQDNTIGPDNVIAHNVNGVYVDDSDSTGNTITQNSIHSNAFLGIDLNDGGNDEIPAPTISASTDACTVSGTAGAGDTVEVFTGPDEEGKRYLATDLADGADDWDVGGPFILDTYVTATATDGSGNTSEFSTQVAADCYPVYLPLGVKNY